ncbi:MAG TPA: response regulator [Pirellulaceae bacterium]|nr:response regulator [Pirellulaceae bacterium]
MNAQPTVYVIDDDPGIRSYISALAKNKGFAAEAFASADDFLNHLNQHGTLAGCAVVDVKLPGMNGLELMQTLNERSVRLPVIVITGFAEVPLAVKAMKAGAVTFLEKPFQDQDLWQNIQIAMEENEQTLQNLQRKAIIEARFAELSSDETAVMMKMLRGLPNKRIAAELDIGLRTVELRRANVLKKMQVDSLAELVRLAMLVGIMPEAEEP